MADKEGNILAKNYALDKPADSKGYFLKGAEHLDWGMKDRLSRIFNPQSGKTVMLAFDHGYIMGPTAGLERLDLAIPPLAEYADVLMATRGAIRTCVPPTFNKAIALRCTTDTSVLHEDLSYGHIGADLITLASMLRIPVCMHNVEEEKIFRPAVWNAFGMNVEGADYRACQNFGPIYK